MIESLLFISIGVASRLLPHPANFTAVGGIALFSGTRMGLHKAVLITIATMGISDMILGFHSIMWATYTSMVLVAFLGYWVRHRSFKLLIAVAFFSSLQFFIITNFAVWLAPNTLYPKTFSGLLECYVMALPFFRNSLLGDAFYTITFFTAADMIKNTKQVLSILKLKN